MELYQHYQTQTHHQTQAMTRPSMVGKPDHTGFAAMLQANFTPPTAMPPGGESSGRAGGQAPHRGGEEEAARSFYTVRSGDTLSGIVAGKLRQNQVEHNRGELYNLVTKVASDNNLTNPDRIFPGQQLNTAGIPRFAAELPSSVAASRTPSEPAMAGSSDGLQPPAMGLVSSTFGVRLHPVTGHEQHHDGLDIMLPPGTPINPVAQGTILRADDNGGYGLTVDIDHGEGLTSRYAHLSQLLVSPGDQVEPGQVIARSGSTGLTNGPHLHLEIHQDEQPVNPLTLISRADIERGPQLADGTRPGDPDAETGEYTVRPGDTLSTIAARELRGQGIDYSPQDLHRTVQQLAAANNLSNPDLIFSGQRINLAGLLSDRHHA